MRNYEDETATPSNQGRHFPFFKQIPNQQQSRPETSAPDVADILDIGNGETPKSHNPKKNRLSRSQKTRNITSLRDNMYDSQESTDTDQSMVQHFNLSDGLYKSNDGALFEFHHYL